MTDELTIDAPSDIPRLSDETLTEFAWNRLRGLRDQRLAESDWTQVADAPVDAKAWAVYRKALRDLPAKTKDPETVKWPTPPGVAE